MASSARAEIDPNRMMYLVKMLGFLRTRGDRPANASRRGAADRLPPHARR